MNLAEAKMGKYKVETLIIGHDLRSRLNSLGIFKGTIIEKTSNNSTGPVSIKVGNASWAFGHGMAKQINISEITR